MKSKTIALFMFTVLQIITGCSVKERLAFYLVKNNNKEVTLDKWGGLEVDASPIFTERDILSYSASNDAMVLTKAALTKLNDIGVGKEFVVYVDQKPVFSGRIWSPLRSASCSEIVLMVPPSGDGQVSLLAGYPTHSYFTGDDQRSNTLFLDALRASGKLKE